MTREGPYTVSSVHNGKYTLIRENGTLVQNGTAVEENNLELVDPFA